MGWARLAFLLSLLSLLLQTDHTFDRDRDLYEECGRSKLRPRDFGMEPRRGRWPWQASLRYKGKHRCGATLIQAEWIITAASCFQLSNNTWDYSVMIGSIYAYPTTRFLATFLQHQEYFPRVTKIIIRSEYIPYQFGDIALVKLSQKIPYRRNISPVCIPLGPWELKIIRQCWITGWGKFGGSQALEGSLELREGRAKITDLDKCENIYGDMDQSTDSESYRNDVLCILMPLYPAERCVGDQGGPLICRIQDIYYQFGIMNWDYDCKPGIKAKTFTSVALYSAWIEKTINSPTTTLSPFRFLLLTLLLLQALLGPF
ncbi:testisin-like [Sarcophilus harrisii]|uniref:Peptidase S1 domain-containing protein n=1 Tax=Sarcophilus harrisii TaxID=9305 RepID=G3VFF6_SARHA|nr:testisin-like [Sarcophilus harrisii]